MMSLVQAEKSDEKLQKTMHFTIVFNFQTNVSTVQAAQHALSLPKKERGGGRPA